MDRQKLPLGIRRGGWRAPSGKVMYGEEKKRGYIYNMAEGGDDSPTDSLEMFGAGSQDCVKSK